MTRSAAALASDLVEVRLDRDVWAVALRVCEAVNEKHFGIRFPDRRWWDDPLSFWRLILGVEPWSRQREVILAVRDHDRVAVKAGRRVSKSHTVAGVALTFYSAFEDARVIMTSTTARQVDAILWRELLSLRAKSGRCFDCRTADPNHHRIPTPCPHSARILGEPGRLARTGLKMNPIDPSDFREIFGFTADEGEAMQGIAGAHVLFIVDEASGVSQAIYDAINGNRAGGARVLLFGNPTKTSGEHFDAFNSNAKPHAPRGYHGITISSRESPNVVEGRTVIPGLATREWIEEREHEWGVGSALAKIHIDGEHAGSEEGKAFPIDMIHQAEQRFETASDAGRLFVGLDPAGESGMGDESAFCPRRGLKAYPISAVRGLTDEGHLMALLGMLNAMRIGREVPVVVVDRDGLGARIYAYFRGYLESLPDGDLPPFELYGLRGSDKPVREADRYDRQRDATAANLAQWFRDGGSIVEDAKLTKELHAIEWKQIINGKLKITAKEDLKKILGRSPDRYDALSLAVWEPSSLRDDAAPPIPPKVVQPQARARPTIEDDDFGSDDPYRPAIDPYGGR